MRPAASAAVAALLLVVAVVVQLSVLSRLGLPAATPDLVLVTVAAVGGARGPSSGAAAGFLGGLLLDLAPPADHPAGQWALVLTVAGYLAGRFAADARPAARRSPRLWRLALVGLLAAGSTVVYALVSAVLGAGWPQAIQLGLVALAAGGYAAVLAVPVLAAADRALGRRALGRRAPAAAGW